MIEISQSQLRREAVELALWRTPAPELEVGAIAALALIDSVGKDQAVGNKAAGDGSSLPDLGPLASFGSWESVASTIMHKAESASAFNPESTTFAPAAWSNFLQKFSTIPFFLTYTYDTRTASISALSLEKGVNAVSDLIQNVMTPDDFEGVMTTIRKMATLAIQNEGQAQKKSNQQVGVLSRKAGKLHLAVVRTEVEMEYKSGKGYEQLTQTIDVYRGYGVLDFDKCERNAGTLLKWDHRTVGDWESGTASAPLPPNQSLAWDE
ncbi:hypothetical protein [Kitasatospora viridis]|uniref:Uncharacterized protein n=1 Tax=Kitasatospora viridis TaxID=281105 RepID=A0A561SFR9_9ACTN|nr:hypothetical protein [Kitasatospora viridis]TWF73710.1 hypothetical protein FHX73_15337 [Kitasatospora viridis]